MEVREIIEIGYWEDGSGFSHSETYSSKVIKVAADTAEGLKDKFDWKWWEREELGEGRDRKITVKYFWPDYDPMFDDEEPLAEFETWEKEIGQ